MGIKGLSKFLGDVAPRSIEAISLNSLTGRVLAIDASLALYQFLIAIRENDRFSNLENAAGEATSHIAGMLNRAIRLMEIGVKPLFVFDGKPPVLKGGELAKRKKKRDQAEIDLQIAEDLGDRENIKKQIGRTVKVNQQHNDDIKRLFKLMGIPTIDAPCEAEAQCAELTKGGKAYATVTEDADALTFGSTILIKNLNFSDNKAKSHPPLAIHLDVALKYLGLTMAEFVDFCILCGCDYCDTIRGIGAKTAFTLIKQHKTIEGVLKTLDTQKAAVPDHFPYEEARRFFKDPEVLPCSEIPSLKWKEADSVALREFLIDEQSFNPIRVDGILKRLKKAWGKSSQSRLEAFFTKPIAKPIENSKLLESSQSLTGTAGSKKTAEKQTKHKTDEALKKTAKRRKI